MKNEIATSPSQSARLIACGVDPKTADMCWRKDYLKQFDFLEANPPFAERDTPTYSLSRLLSLLPPTISAENGDEELGDYDLFIYPSITGKIWAISYAYTEDGYTDYLLEVKDSNIIEAIVKAIEWLTKEGYKLNQIEK